MTHKRCVPATGHIHSNSAAGACRDLRPAVPGGVPLLPSPTQQLNLACVDLQPRDDPWTSLTPLCLARCVRATSQDMPTQLPTWLTYPPGALPHFGILANVLPIWKPAPVGHRTQHATSSTPQMAHQASQHQPLDARAVPLQQACY